MPAASDTQLFAGLCAAALAALSGAQWHFVFGWEPTTWLTAAAAGIPAIALGITSRLERPRPAVGWVVSLVALYWFTGVWVLHDAVGRVLPSGASVGATIDAIRNGWAEILSLALPVPAAPRYLVLPVVVTGLASLGGVALVVRTPWPLAGAVPPAAAFVLAILFGIGAGGSRVTLSAAFVFVTLVLAGTTWRPRDVRGGGGRSIRSRRLLEVGVCAAVVAALSAGVGPLLPFVRTAAPYDPRTTRVPPLTVASALNPLDLLTVWARKPGGPVLMRVHWSGPPHTLRMAVLDRFTPFDGWTNSSRFSQAGARLSSSRSFLHEHVVSQTVHIASLPPPWTPAAGHAVSIRGVRVGVQASTGVLVDTGVGRRPTYTVTSVVSTRACTYDASVPFAPGEAPSVPSDVARLASEYASGATTPCARAEAVARAFARYSFNPSAPSGSNLPAIESFLFGARSSGGESGTYEQVASAYGLMVESLGMKARVVVGFHAGEPQGNHNYVVRPRDAFAWVEVDFKGAGWVPFYPTPRGAPTPRADKTDQASSPLHQNPNLLKPTARAPREGAVSERAPAHRQSGAGTLLVPFGIALCAMLLVLLLAALVVGTVRARRRRCRRRVSEPKRRVVGAWEETLDELASLNVRRRGPETVGEMIAAGGDALGGNSSAVLTPLANLTNAAYFSPEPLDPHTADEAWRCAELVATLVHGRLTRWERTKRAVDVRVLARR